MKLAEVKTAILDPTFRRVLPPFMDSPAARCELYAIGLQESKFLHRVQVIDGGGEGPARSFWQFERGGGVRGVMTHPASAKYARAVAGFYGIAFDARLIHQIMGTNDGLGCCFARLLLLTDAAAIPAPTPENEQAGWDMYLRNWRPGKPHRNTWGAHWRAAVEMTRTAG